LQLPPVPSAAEDTSVKLRDIRDEAMNAGLAADRPIPVGAKMLRLELLKTKAELERSLSELVLDCRLRNGGALVQGVSVADPGHRGIGIPRRPGTMV
jgi:hypothetical protein